ncbi:MAG: tetratricopeptide repeat protein [Rhodospirillaceae bacterium]|nr:MAG: tetratricopeptide repeat protein [Rhodospirillaceae bacterium]
MPFRFFTLSGLASLTALAFAPPVHAAAQSMACFTATAEPAARIVACGVVAADDSLPAAIRANALAIRAGINTADGKLAHALADYDAALTLNPHDGAAMLARGKLREMQDDTSGAMADYSSVLAVDPASAEAYGRRGALRLKSSDNKSIDQALADLTEAHRLNPADAAVSQLLGMAQLRANHSADAIATFSTLLATSPDNVDALHGRATALGRQGNFTAAIADLDALLKLRPDDKEALKARGVAALQADKLQPAIADFTRLLTLTPGDVETLFFRATARFRAGDIANAESDFDAVLAKRPRDPDALAGRALARMTAGRLAEAETDFSIALTIAPHAGTLLADRGRLRVLRGDYSGAAQDLAAAMETMAATPDVAVWRFIADGRNNQDGVKALSAARRKFAADISRKASWPMAAVRYFLGEIPAAEMITDVGDHPLQQCEAAYYLGQAALARRDRAEAMRQFATATSTDARGSFAFIGAKIELAKLHKN